MARKILQAGVAKSGNFWLYQIINRLLCAAGVEVVSVIKKQEEYEELSKLDLSFEGQVDIDTIEISGNAVDLVVSKIFRKRLDYHALPDANFLFWTHSIFNKGWFRFLRGNDKIVYIIRDPRDVFISKINFAFGDYGKRFLGDRGEKSTFRRHRIYSSTYAWIENAIRILDQLSKREDRIIIVFYEDLLRDLKGTMSSLAQQLELDLQPEDVAVIAEQVSAGKLRKASSGHVSKEIAIGKWKGALSPREHRWFKYVFGDGLDFFLNANSALYLRRNKSQVVRELKRARRRVILSPKFYLSLIFDGRSGRELILKMKTYLLKANGRVD